MLNFWCPKSPSSPLRICVYTYASLVLPAVATIPIDLFSRNCTTALCSECSTQFAKALLIATTQWINRYIFFCLHNIKATTNTRKTDKEIYINININVRTTRCEDSDCGSDAQIGTFSGWTCWVSGPARMLFSTSRTVRAYVRRNICLSITRRKDLFNEGPPVDNCAPYLGGPAHRELGIHKFSFLSLCRSARPPQNIDLTGKHTHTLLASCIIGTLMSTFIFDVIFVI